MLLGVDLTNGKANMVGNGETLISSSFRLLFQVDIVNKESFFF